MAGKDREANRRRPPGHRKQQTPGLWGGGVGTGSKANYWQGRDDDLWAPGGGGPVPALGGGIRLAAAPGGREPR
jgi:hypothetical protein